MKIEQQTVFEQIVIFESGLLSFLEAVKQKWADGWELDPDDGPMMYNFAYKTAMRRDAEHVKAEADRIAAGKPSRAEILAKARDAKAAKQREAANV